MFETYMPKHKPYFQLEWQDSWTSNDMELTVCRKLAGLDEAYNVFHAPIYTYCFLSFYYDSISEWYLFQTKALEANIWEYI